MPVYDVIHVKMLMWKELIKLHGGTLDIESVTAAESKDGSRKSSLPLGSQTTKADESRRFDIPLSNTVRPNTPPCRRVTDLTDSVPIIYPAMLLRAIRTMSSKVPMGKVSSTRLCSGTEIAKAAVSIRRVIREV